MRSYRQYCGLARALDVVGDRWTLLIVRELLVRGSARYSDLQQGLPGIATNLLASRLRQMEDAGLIQRVEALRPGSAAFLELAPRGRELDAVIAAFGRWAAPLMGEPRPGDFVRGHWFVLPARLYLHDRSPKLGRAAIQIDFGDEAVVVETAGDGTVTAKPGRVNDPAATLYGPPGLVMGLLGGRMTLAQARVRGLRLSGSVKAVNRIRTKPGKGGAN